MVRPIAARICSCRPSCRAGVNTRNTNFTGSPSGASHANPAGARPKATSGRRNASMRACGTATPLPMAVPISRSRVSTSAVTSATDSRVAGAAARHSSRMAAKRSPARSAGRIAARARIRARSIDFRRRIDHPSQGATSSAEATAEQTMATKIGVEMMWYSSATPATTMPVTPLGVNAMPIDTRSCGEMSRPRAPSQAPRNLATIDTPVTNSTSTRSKLAMKSRCSASPAK